MKFGKKLFQAKLLSRLSHKVCRLLSSPVLLRKFTNVRQNGRCVISILKEFCFFATDFNTNYLWFLTNCQSKSFNCNHEQIWRKRITLPHARFQRKKVSCETIVDNTTFNIVVQCSYPPNKFRTKTKGFLTAEKKVPF